MDRKFKAIIENVNKHVALSADEAKYFISRLEGRQIKKREPLLRDGEHCDHINFVIDGALRAYFRDGDGNENIVMFAVSDWWITDMHAFVSGKSAMLNIDALEASDILRLEKADLNELYDKVPKFERFFRVIMQNAYVREQLRVIENLSLPAHDRYENFLRKYPQFAERIPLKQIASYLGITPEFLSVLRAKRK